MRLWEEIVVFNNARRGMREHRRFQGEAELIGRCCGLIPRVAQQEGSHVQLLEEVQLPLAPLDRLQAVAL